MNDSARHNAGHFVFTMFSKESWVSALPVFPLLENELVRLTGKLHYMVCECVHFSRSAVKESAVLRIHSIQHNMQMVMRGILICRMHRPDQLVVVLEIRSNRRRIFYLKLCIICLFIKGKNNVHNRIGQQPDGWCCHCLRRCCWRGYEISWKQRKYVLLRNHDKSCDLSEFLFFDAETAICHPFVTRKFRWMTGRVTKMYIAAQTRTQCSDLLLGKAALVAS